MKTVIVERPHGFLLWKGKQTSLASDRPLPSGEPVTITCAGEAYGEAVLGQPVAVSLSEFEKMQPEHCITPAERALYWPGARAFYVHPLREWRPYEALKALDGLEPTEAEQALLARTEVLPKTVVIDEAAVVLSGGLTTIKPAVAEPDRIEAMVKAALGDTALAAGRYVSLYQLALVKTPRPIVEAGEPASPFFEPAAETGGADQYTGDEPGGGPAVVEADDKQQEEGVMPYVMMDDHPDCNGIAVVKKDSNEVMGCHDDEDKAAAQMQALMAAEADEEKDEDKGDPEPAEGDKATWSTAMVNDLPDSSFLYVAPGGDKDDEGKTVPRSLRYFPYKNAQGEIDLPHLRNAIARIPQSDLSDTLKNRLQRQAQSLLEKENKSDEKAGRRLKGAMLEKLKGLMRSMQELVGWAENANGEDDEEDKPRPAVVAPGMMFGKSLVGVKTVNGAPWFFATSTNAFRDREQEIFSTKALERYVSEAEQSGSRGFFNFWHIPGTDFARKQWQGVVGRFLIEAGPFLDDARGQAARKFFEQYPSGHPDIAPEGWGCSPEYRYLPEERKSGVYEWIWITRTSTLPRAAAANLWTKGGIMPLTDQQKQAAEALFGADLTAQIIAGAEAQTKELEEAGVAHKDAPETPAETPAPVDAEAVAAVLAKQFTTDLAPLAEAVAALAGKMDELGERVKKLEKAESVKAQAETPRFLFKVQRATEAEATEVKEEDKLLDQKPAEAKPKDGSGAGHFFSARK